MLYARTIFDKPAQNDGYRILCTREWPARFAPSWADGFNPNLSPSQEIYELLLDRRISFEEFESKFRQELANQAERLKSLKRQGEKFTVTIVSYPDFEKKSIGAIVISECERQ